MKKIFIILIGTLFCANFSLAQDETSTYDFGVFRLSYGMAEFEDIEKIAGIEVSDAGRFHEISMAFSQAFSVYPKVPLFFEIGTDLSYIFGGNEAFFGDDDSKLHIFSVRFPLNLMYSFETSKKVSIKPFIGVNARVNIVGKFEYSGDEDFNFFDKELGGGRRLSTGWQTGAYLKIDETCIGLSYNEDMSPIYKYESNIYKNKSIRVSIGCFF